MNRGMTLLSHLGDCHKLAPADPEMGVPVAGTRQLSILFRRRESKNWVTLVIIDLAVGVGSSRLPDHLIGTAWLSAKLRVLPCD